MIQIEAELNSTIIYAKASRYNPPGYGIAHTIPYDKRPEGRKERKERKGTIITV